MGKTTQIVYIDDNLTPLDSDEDHGYFAWWPFGTFAILLGVGLVTSLFLGLSFLSETSTFTSMSSKTSLADPLQTQNFSVSFAGEISVIQKINTSGSGHVRATAETTPLLKFKMSSQTLSEEAAKALQASESDFQSALSSYIADQTLDDLLSQKGRLDLSQHASDLSQSITGISSIRFTIDQLELVNG